MRILCSYSAGARPRPSSIKLTTSLIPPTKPAQVGRWRQAHWLVLVWVSLWFRGVAAQVPFTEESLIRGLAQITSNGTTFGKGFALNDLDGDGDLDALLTGRFDGAVTLYENDGTGFFTDVTPASGLPVDISLHAVACADYDADGDLDVYLSGWYAPNMLLRNEGDLTFVDVTIPPLDNSGPTQGCAWGDYNGDGYLDLFVTDYAIGNSQLLTNLGGTGSFEVADYGIIPEVVPAFQGRFFDYDRDGDLDLYVSVDRGALSPYVNRLYQNDGNTFVDVAPNIGAALSIDSMGVGIGDWNRDGYFDLYVTNTPDGNGNVLLMSDGAGAFLDQSALYGVDVMHTSWGAPVFDYNHDGYEDIFAAVHGLNVFYQAGSNFPWPELANQLQVDQTGLTFVATAGDLDGDGDLDLLVQYANQPLRVYVNQAGNNLPYLEVKLSSAGPNRFGVGAIVAAKTGGVIQTRMIHGSGSYKNSTPFSAHFGFPSGTQSIDEVVVHWPGGAQSVLGGIAINQTLTISEPTPPFVRGDTNSDGLLDLSDAITNLGLLFLGASSECWASHDANADDLLNLADTLYLLEALFSGGAQPPAPYPDCGVDDFSDLDCGFSSCFP